MSLLFLLVQRPLFPWWACSLAVIIGLLLWSAYYIRDFDALVAPLHQDAKTKELQKVRWVFALAGAAQLIVILFFGSDYATSLKREESAVALALSLGWYFLTTIIQSQIQFRIERRLRNISATQHRALMGFLRMLGVGMSVYVSYIVAYTLAIWLFDVAFNSFKLSGAAREAAGWISLIISLFVALGAMYVASPIVIRGMIPCTRLADSRIREILKGCFSRASLSVPRFWIIETEHVKSYNALVAGVSWGLGWFRQGLFFSRGLVEKLEPKEFEAVIMHEVSHIILHHIRQRFFLTVAAALAGLIPCAALVAMMVFLIPDAYRSLAVLVVVFCGVAFQIHLIRWLVRYQELQADAYAVVYLGASVDVFAAALTKLHRLNDLPLDKRSPSTLIDPNAAHPVTEKRIAALKEEVARISRGHDFSLTKALLTGFWQDVGKYWVVAVVTVLSLDLASLLIYVKPAHQMYEAAANGNVPAIRALASKGISPNAPDPLAFDSTPILIASARGHLAAVLVLSDLGVDVNEASRAGLTPLHAAALTGHGELVRHLLSKGAKPWLKDEAGNSAIVYAVSSGNSQTVQFLIRGGPILTPAMRGARRWFRLQKRNKTLRLLIC